MLNSPSEKYKGKFSALTDDQQAVVVREAQEALFGLKTLADLSKSGPAVPLDMAYNILYVTEARVAELSKILGIELDSTKDREERYAALRAANLKVANLQRMLGQAASPELVKQGVDVMIDKLRAWWEADGFGYTSDAHVTGNGMYAKLSCSLNTRSYSYSRTPVSDRQSQEDWLKSLQEHGFELVHVRNDDPAVAATEENQKLLKDLLTSKFPSVRLFSFNGYMNQDQKPTLREVEVFFPDLTEIAALPELKAYA